MYRHTFGDFTVYVVLPASDTSRPNFLLFKIRSWKAICLKSCLIIREQKVVPDTSYRAPSEQEKYCYSVVVLGTLLSCRSLHTHVSPRLLLRGERALEEQVPKSLIVCLQKHLPLLL